MIDPKSVMFEEGRRDALDLAGRAKDLDGTAIIAEEDHIPAWREDAVYTAAHVGFPVRDKGQVYTILMPHTPAHNPGSRPETLRAIYDLKHTKDPERAKPFVAPQGTSGLYEAGECCTENGRVYRCKVDRNPYGPGEYPGNWEEVGQW